MNLEIFDRIQQVACQLNVRGQNLSVAESCTGGLLGANLTDLAGASSYFKGGVLAYANPVKIEVLGVSRESLASYGAVSEEVASEMALGVRNLIGSDWALSTTGVAGPGGGTADKPVGTVWIGLADCRGAFSRKLEFSGVRRAVRYETVIAALEILLEKLVERSVDL